MGKLSSNFLKIIAMVLMLIDHIAMFFFPKVAILRIIGRISFPIFAFMVAEGCRYTRNKLRYFLSVFLLAIVVQLVYFLVEGSLFMCVLVSFSLAIPMVYALQYLKSVLIVGSGTKRILLAVVLLLLSIGLTVGVCLIVEVDYGIMGCFLPFIASIFYVPNEASEKLRSYDTTLNRIIVFSVGVLALGLIKGGLQIFGILSIPILLLYSGKRGRYNIKYFFYLFYPLHLAILEAISILIR